MHARPRIRVTTQPASETRQHRTRILYGLMGLVVLGLLAFVVWRSQQHDLQRAKGPRDRPAQEYVVTEKPTPMRQDLRLPQDYTKLALDEPPPAAKPPVPGQPAPPPVVQPSPRTGRWTPPPPAQPRGFPPLPPPPPSQQVIVQAPRPPTAAPRGVQPTSTARAAGGGVPARWFGAKTAVQGNLLSAPLPPEKSETEASTLFPKAVWERPKDPKKVLYADQIINGVLQQNLNTETPGTLRIKVTQDIVDRWGLGQVLLPVDTTLLATTEGTLRYGQQRVPAAVTMGILPDGTALSFRKGQAGDAMGAAGVPVDVNNHYWALLAATGIQAVLNIGTRTIAGSTTSFNPTVEQQIADEIARSVNRTGNQVVQRELSRTPTGEQEYGFPVTVQFSENINMQSAPTIVAK